jgi:L-ribulose-5-phosphate 3-epimerase UlaE
VILESVAVRLNAILQNRGKQMTMIVQREAASVRNRRRFQFGSSAGLNRPRDWQVFERLVRNLFAEKTIRLAGWDLNLRPYETEACLRIVAGMDQRPNVLVFVDADNQRSALRVPG